MDHFNSWRVCGLRCVVLPRTESKSLSYSPEATFRALVNLYVEFNDDKTLCFNKRKLCRLRRMPWAKLIEHCMLYTNAECNKVGIKVVLRIFDDFYCRIFHLLSPFPLGDCASAQLPRCQQRKEDAMYRVAKVVVFSPSFARAPLSVRFVFHLN